jgi:exodeoxyribonuclease X
MTVFRVCDIETTGIDPEQHAIVEIACTDVVDRQLATEYSSLVKPPHPIPPEAMAVHHITDADVADAPEAREIVPLFLGTDYRDMIYVAHNSQFEQGFLAPYVPGARWLCTFKSGLRVWPDAPGHSNQVLRYVLGLQLSPGAPHRAGPDTIVTANILLELLRHASVEDMLAWTMEPPIFKTVRFGKKHRGEPWVDLPQDYLLWIIEKSDLDDDTKWNAKRVLKMRRAEAEKKTNEARNAYTALAVQAAAIALTVADLETWFRGETANRSKHGVYPNTPPYKRIVDACAARKAALSPKKEATITIPTTEKTNARDPEYGSLLPPI